MGFESEIDDTINGKFFMIDVPDFRAGIDGAKSLRSYLRLGVASQNAGNPQNKEDGEDLASLVMGFTDDTRDRGLETSREEPEDIAEKGGPRAPGHGLTVEQRKERSRQLHKLGGWRDHSDGNRITTTNGDKVEVIRGNYKLIVLGRQAAELDEEGEEGLEKRIEALEHGSAWEASGGQVDSADPAFGQNPEEKDRKGAASLYQTALEIRYEWIREGIDKGRWKRVQEEGKEEEEHNGIFEETIFAHRLMEQKGSSKRRILEINESTYAVEVKDTKDVKITTEVLNGESLSETFNLKNYSDVKQVSGDLFESTQAGSLTDMKTAGAITEVTKAGALAEVVVAGAIADAKVAGVIAGADVAGVLIEAKLAGFIVDLIVGPELKGHVGPSFQFHNTHFYKTATVVDMHGMQIKVMGTAVHTHAGPKVSMAPMQMCTGGMVHMGT